MVMYGDWYTYLMDNKKEEELLSLTQKKGANSILNPMEMTPIHMEAMQGSIGMIEKLMLIGGDINQADRAGRKPIHYRLNNYEDTKKMIECGADINYRTNNGYSAIDYCVIKEGSLNVLNLLLDMFPKQIKNEGESLIYSIQAENKEAFELLIERGVPLTSKRTPRRLTALDAACSCKDPYYLSRLIESGVDVNYYRKRKESEHPIFEVIQAKDIVKIEMFLETERFDVSVKNRFGSDLFEMAVTFDCMEPFLAHEINIENGLKMLSEYKTVSNRKKIEYLLENEESFYPSVRRQIKKMGLKLMIS